MYRIFSVSCGSDEWNKETNDEIILIAFEEKREIWWCSIGYILNGTIACVE